MTLTTFLITICAVLAIPGIIIKNWPIKGDKPQVQPS
jgi:hypothetical protein